MPTVIRNTPTELVPQELFNAEKIQEYWNVLYPNHNNETIGADELGEFFLLYPKPKDVDTVHEITLMYQNLREKPNAIGIEVYKNSFNVLVVKNSNVAFIGYFNYVINEDILYHLANVSQHFFEDIASITIFYKQLSSKMLILLNKYFEMKQL